MTKEYAEQRLRELREQIKALQNEEKSIKEFISNVERDEKTKEFLSTVYSVSEENSMFIRLYNDTRTTPIMDSFLNSDKKFLVFNQIFRLSNPNNYIWPSISLVIRKGALGISAIDSGLTMTDLKKLSGAPIIHGIFPENSRFYSLAEELLSVANSEKASNNAIALEHPVRLGGQTYANQTGFGSEYHGDTFVQGTLYGETTSFYVIGFIVN